MWLNHVEKGVWDIRIDLNPIHGIRLNPLMLRVKIGYNKMVFKINFMTRPTKSQVRLMIRLEYIRVTQWDS